MHSDSFSKWLRRAAAGAVLVAACVPVQALNVFTCEPEWAALVRELAPAAQVHSATHALQDPHHIEARPSLIAAVRRADLAVCSGAELESGWLPMLQQRSGNARIQDRRTGMFYASDYVTLIDQRPPGGLFDGDVHPDGNPHFHLDPHRLLDVAEGLAQRLGEVDAPRAAEYLQRHADFAKRWKQKIVQWEAQAAPLRGRQVAAQHTTFAYLWRWVGMEQVADLEPKPGMPPTPGHLQRVLGQVRAKPPTAIVVASYQDSQPARWLAQQLGGAVPVLQLPATVTEEAPATDLSALYEHLLRQLLAAAK